MAALKRQISKRDSTKNQMAQFVSFVRSCNAQNSAQLPARLTRAAEIFNKFDELQLDIEVLKQEALNSESAEATPQQIEELNNDMLAERANFEDSYFAAVAQAHQIIKAAETQPVQNNAIFGHKLNVKLPMLQIPEFDGNYHQWMNFRDTFSSVIHTRDELSNVQKLQYLRSSLSGEAAQCIEALETTEANYDVAWDLLTQRYENKKLIINTHLKELFELEHVTKAISHTTLRRFIDTVRMHIRALESLGQPVAQWDTILVYMISNKLDYTTRRDWELHAGKDDPNNLPKMDDLFEFLTHRSNTLQLVESSKPRQEPGKSNFPKYPEKKVSLSSTIPPICEYCQGEHYIYRCEEFERLPIVEKRQEVRKRLLCYNCLKKGHYLQSCTASTCKKCSEKHNTLLHNDINEYTGKSVTKNETKAVLTSNCNIDTRFESSAADQRMNDEEDIAQIHDEISVVNHAVRHSQVVLATAQIQIFNAEGKLVTCRALLDPGSQSNIVTKDFVRKLGLPRQKVNIPVSGVCLSRSDVKETTQVQIKSMHNSFSTMLECLILPVITEKLPQMRIDPETLKIPSRLNLADPNYHIPGTIDLLIGGGVFWKLLCVGQEKLGTNEPLLHKTLLGWVIGGDLINSRMPAALPRCQLLSTTTLEHQMEKFWKIEELQSKKFYTPKEQFCEEYYQKTTTRKDDGRFIVRLPKDTCITLGNSEEFALRRLYALERRLIRNPELKLAYNEFLKEYEAIGHMSEVVNESHEKSEEDFYLPHQPVIRATSLTTKVRVVFDGSAKSATGASLNDKLLTGPNLQEEIIDIVIRFRCHQYVITADVAMMFRQILVHEEDRELQRILWREDSKKPVKKYTLNTVTYGTSCAPYLAIRCLKQLAEEQEAKLYPEAAKALRNDFYMDDVLTGCSTVEGAIELQQQLQDLLAKGQLPLRKWRANNANVLKHLTEDRKADNLMILDKQEPLKTLGLLWDSSSDTLQYSVDIVEGGKPTKRNILSQIARIYDPMGLIGPVLIIAKMMMQELWKLKLAWDESVPQAMYTDWLNYYSALPKINGLKISRNANPDNNSEYFELHGFGDASEKAYGACVYCSYKTDNDGSKSFLLCSKTRVAPLKTISLPKLELCAALLLTKLVDSATKALQGKVQNTYLWSDSTIVLCWINSSPHELKTFFANRVAEIQSLTTKATWNHVPSEENPADLLSRGVSVENILENKLWWHGPDWIVSRELWPSQKWSGQTQDPGRKPEIILTTTQLKIPVLEKYSSFSKLERIFGYCARFIKNTKGDRQYGNLTPEELDKSTTIILRIVQDQRFARELIALRAENSVDNKSPLKQLNPFIDDNGLIRVGGRLRHANISADERHPIVLPSRHHITTLILRQEHVKLLHCGPQHLLSSIRMKYWPLSGRREARKITQGCVSCFRYRPRALDTMMGDLPTNRVTESVRPFDRCGVDYAGPFLIRESKRRGKIPTSKAYIAVFTCFQTKAVHLELVSSLSTESFLAALRRFSARRGTCSHMYSDNGSNFIGAARELNEIYDFLKKEENEIATKLAVQRVTWHFIPPRAPHFGGLWEAAVKSVKRHLMITMKDLLYTFEEYYTLLSEIEAILNSRPLTPLSSDPNDFTALTPSHFLIGDSLLQPVEKNYVDVPDNRLNRWQHLQKLKQHYWKRWHREYLQQLQSRTKWPTRTQNLEIGTLVLLMEDNLPPLQWKLGRVIEVHPGDDKIVRVATVQTSTAIYKRAVKKLCALPDNTIKNVE